MQMVSPNLHIGLVIEDDKRNIINRAQGLKKLPQGRQQRFNGLTLSHRSRIVNDQHDVKRDRFTALKGLGRQNPCFAISAAHQKIFGL